MKYLATTSSHKHKSFTLFLPWSVKVITLSLLGLINPWYFLAPVSALPPAFEDIEGNWAQQCIDQLAHRDIMTEYSYGLFQPNFPMTRGDYAATVIKAFPNAPLKRMEETFNFIDLPETYWGVAPIREAWLTGFVIGYPGNVFLPFEPISRLEVVLSLMSGLDYIPNLSTTLDQELIAPSTPLEEDQAEKERQQKLLESLETYFVDAQDIPPYAREVILTAIEHDLIVNYPYLAEFRPHQPATRAEIAALLCQALKTTGVVPSRYIVQENGAK
jgi:hypothetical protein